VKNGKNVTYAEIDAPHATMHSSSTTRTTTGGAAYIDNVADEVGAAGARSRSSSRTELEEMKGYSRRGKAA